MSRNSEEDDYESDEELDLGEFDDASSQSSYGPKQSGSDNSDNSDEEEGEDEDEYSDVDDDSPQGQGEANAEKEIEGDFDLQTSRLVQNIRLTDGASGSNTGLGKDWDFNMEEKEAEFRDDLRAASGIGRKRRKKGRNPGPVLSPEVRALIGDGNQAYVDSDLPETVRIMQEVIRIEPRAASAWSVLAQCYDDMHQSEKALQLRIMAAHLRHDAEEWDRLAQHSKELGYSRQALYCYGKLYSLDPTNVDALWDRASLAKEIGDLRTARNAFLAILKRFPHDLTVLSELRTILIELSDLSTCASLFQRAFEHYQLAYPSGWGRDPNDETPTNTRDTRSSTAAAVPPNLVPGGGFGLMEILVLADLYNTPTLAEHEKAVEVIRKGCRWLQGRADQRYWDICEDDREYDLYMPSGERVGRDGDVEPGMFPLDVNARHRLAVARIKMGEVEEGKMHADIVLSQDVLDYAPLFVEIADAYFERELYADAKPIYELLGADAGTSSMYILLQTAACLRMLDELREAAEVYEYIRATDPTLNDAKMKLAEIYEILNEPRKALELVYEVIDSRKKRPKEGDPSTSSTPADPGAGASLFSEERPTTTKSKSAASRHNRLTPAQLRELEAEKEQEVIRGYKRMTEIWGKMLGENEDGHEDALREWVIEAEKLVEMYRETRNLFLTTKGHFFRGMFPRSRAAAEQDDGTEEDRMVSRLQLDLGHDTLVRKTKTADRDRGRVDVFRGVSFEDWLHIFIQYAFLLTKRDQYDRADEILRHLLVSNPYQSRDFQDIIRIAITTCAISTHRHTVVVEQCRKLISVHQFNNEPLRILLASIASGLRPTDTFITSTLQKHLFREMKIIDVAVKNPETMKWNHITGRFAPTTTQGKGGEADEDDDDGAGRNEGEEEVPEENDAPNGKIATFELPKKDNPINVAIYGQICIAAKSYQSAIFYLLHAFDYCPDDPMICLCLAIASIGRAMQRQSDNRHHLITQSLAFLSRYRTLRGSGAPEVDEVNFNFGRAFHQLALYSHAARHYERVLEMAEKRAPEDCGCAREAAYNLSMIYVMTGATPLAQALYRRWLSF